tara:strand:- start:11625 stop:11804 length:180 start_codon:yes stop_codon:yes gene_type:complete
MKKLSKEWCSITLFNKLKVCLIVDVDLKDIDLFTLMFQVRRGIGITIAGLTIAMEWRVG